MNDKKVKRCHVCGEIKPITEFYKSRSRYDGLQGLCKICAKEKNKKYNTSEAYKKWVKHRPHYAWAKSSIKSHKRKGFEVNIVVKELAEIAKKIKYCPFCDVLLSWNQGNGDGKLHPNSPTLDRINNGKVINRDNIRIICHRCNTTKSGRNMEEFVNYCRGIIERYDTPQTAMMGTTSTVEPHGL